MALHIGGIITLTKGTDTLPGCAITGIYTNPEILENRNLSYVSNIPEFDQSDYLVTKSAGYRLVTLRVSITDENEDSPILLDMTGITYYTIDNETYLIQSVDRRDRIDRTQDISQNIAIITLISNQVTVVNPVEGITVDKVITGVVSYKFTGNPDLTINLLSIVSARLRPSDGYFPILILEVYKYSTDDIFLNEVARNNVRLTPSEANFVTIEDILITQDFYKGATTNTWINIPEHCTHDGGYSESQCTGSTGMWIPEHGSTPVIDAHCSWHGNDAQSACEANILQTWIPKHGITPAHCTYHGVYVNETACELASDYTWIPEHGTCSNPAYTNEIDCLAGEVLPIPQVETFQAVGDLTPSPLPSPTMNNDGIVKETIKYELRLLTTNPDEYGWGAVERNMEVPAGENNSARSLPSLPLVKVPKK